MTSWIWNCLLRTMILWEVLWIDRLEHLPSQGEEVVCGNVRLVVEQVEKNRIDKVHLYILPGEKKRNRTKAKSRLNTKAETAHKMLAFWDNIC